MSNYNTLPVKPVLIFFSKLQDHYKIVFMSKNDLVIAQAYAPLLGWERACAKYTKYKS